MSTELHLCPNCKTLILADTLIEPQDQRLWNTNHSICPKCKNPFIPEELIIWTQSSTAASSESEHSKNSSQSGQSSGPSPSPTSCYMLIEQTFVDGNISDTQPIKLIDSFHSHALANQHMQELFDAHIHHIGPEDVLEMDDCEASHFYINESTGVSKHWFIISK